MLWIQKEIQNFIEAAIRSRELLRLSLVLLGKNQHILAYPLLALGILLVTLPVINTFLLAVVASLVSIFTTAGLSGLWFTAIFSFFSVLISLMYASTINSFFSCATAATVLTRLEHHHTAYGTGFKILKKHYRRVIFFGLLSPVFSIIYLVTNRPKNVRRLFEVVAQSLSINTAIIAPSILYTDKGVRETMRDATGTLGKGWRMQFVFKALVLLVIVLLLSISFLPGFIGDATSHGIGTASYTIERLVKFMIALSLFIATHILASVYTAVLYHTIKSETTESSGDK